MKRTHLLRVEEGPERFAPLFAAVREAGMRLGWLELAVPAPAPVPEGLATAADCGALRAVGVGAGRSVAVKPLKGEAVLADLLREHFLGCDLVLVRGEVEAPLLEAWGERFRVLPPGGAGRDLSPAELAARLRRPRPW